MIVSVTRELNALFTGQVSTSNRFWITFNLLPAWPFLFFSTATFLYLRRRILKQTLFLKESIDTQGTVIRINETKDKDEDKIFYQPVFEFADETHTKHEITSSTKSSLILISLCLQDGTITW